MRPRSLVFGAMALTAVALAPRAASAQGAPPPGACAVNVYTPVLGIGGALFGCMGTITASQLFENADYISYLYWFKNMPPLDGAGAPIPLPTPANYLFDDDGGVLGGGNGAYICPGGFCEGPKFIAFAGTNFSNELVFGLNVPEAPYPGPTGAWEYSGRNDGRNAIPAPPGFQAILLENTSVVNEFVLIFEDMNSNCTSASPNRTSITSAQLADPTYLTTQFKNCTGTTSTPSDRDYNDFFVILDVQNGIRTDIPTVPEPATLSLLATGLVGLAGAGMRRRNRK